MYFLYTTKRLDFLIILKVLISFNFIKLPLIQTLSNAFSILDIKTTVAIDNSRNKLRLTNFFYLFIQAYDISSFQNTIRIPMECNFNLFLVRNVLKELVIKLFLRFTTSDSD